MLVVIALSMCFFFFIHSFRQPSIYLLTMKKRVGGCVSDRGQFRHAVRSTASLLDDLDFLRIRGCLNVEVPSEITSADSLFDWMMSTGKLVPENVQQLIAFLNTLQLHTDCLKAYVSDQLLQQQCVNEHKKRRLHDIY